MSSEHLWDPGADPDPDVRRLEHLLARYRHVERGAPAWTRPSRPRWPWFAAAAAAVIVCTWTAWRFLRPADEAAYRVEGLAGVARVRAGEHVETDATGSARIEIAALGHVDVGGATRVRIDDCGTAGHHLYLERGRVSASILAAPRVFQIDTPAGRTIDLGCAYEIEVDDSGVAHVSVTSGQIEFVVDGRELYVPAQASCEARPGLGATWPKFADTSGALNDVVAIASGAKMLSTGGDDVKVVDGLLAACTERDTLTLWHVFDSTLPAPWIRERVYDRLVREFPLPPGIDEAAVLAGDREARRAWRDEMSSRWRTRPPAGSSFR